MSERSKRLEALRRPLSFAAEDGFHALDRIRDLGPTLRRACDRLAEVAAINRELVVWRGDLDGFEKLDRKGRAVAVARGLRLCQTEMARTDPPRAAVTEKKKTEAPASPLDAPTDSLPGIGATLSARLAERNFETVEDLLWFVPRRYDDVRTVKTLAQAVASDDGQRETLRGTIASVRFSNRGRRRWLDVRLVDAEVADARVVIRWFGVHGGMAKQFPKGGQAVVSGPLRRRAGAVEMANPDVLSIVGPDGEAIKATDSQIIPRYGDILGVPAATVRKACRAAVERVARHVVDGVPAEIAKRQGLGSLAEALLTLHSPDGELSAEDVLSLNAGTSSWQRRLAFDELFVLGLAVATRRRLRRAHIGVPAPRTPAAEQALATALPFTMTGAQIRAVDDIRTDLAGERPMNRLLQGDVGSGKTAVAFAAVVQAVAAGCQAALMVPTEILAEQHHRSLSEWCEELGIKVALLTASTPRAIRSSTLSLLAAGQVDFLVGTHSLLSEGVVFSDLALVVVDEQHRFGVAQRFKLRQKGQRGAPHLLVMTATPIPRTLALTAYGDLDVSVIDELPPGRTPIVTQIMSGKRGRERARKELATKLVAGAQAYVVCPMVEPSPDDETRRSWADATSTADELSVLFPEHNVGLVHGRMNQRERDQVMGAFRSGKLDVLVSTTVIEVGVDVPTATVMVIEDADHFGLAQLHQLRGRVGRGAAASHCYLLTRGNKTADGYRRLSVMAETTDGFRIAEEDLRIRGPGELLGKRQAGLPKLRFGDLREHAELLVAARREAEALISEDPDLTGHPVTRQVLLQRAGDIEVYGAESG